MFIKTKSGSITSTGLHECDKCGDWYDARGNKPCPTCGNKKERPKIIRQYSDSKVIKTGEIYQDPFVCDYPSELVAMGIERDWLDQKEREDEKFSLIIMAIIILVTPKSSYCDYWK